MSARSLSATAAPLDKILFEKISLMHKDGLKRVHWLISFATHL